MQPQQTNENSLLEAVSDTLTINEAKLLMEVRKLRPFGKIEISADQNGKWDKFLVHSSHKVVIE